MFYSNPSAPLPMRALRLRQSCFSAFCLTLLFCAASVTSRAQYLERELTASERVFVQVKNRNGRVTVRADEEERKTVLLRAESLGASVADGDVVSKGGGGRIEIDVRERGEQDRIDLLVRVPRRAKVKIESVAGAVSVVGHLEAAEVETDTGTIHADVPVDALRFKFVWEASRPRYFSDDPLPEIKEGRGGVFSVSGKLGDEKAKKEERVRLDFTTQRGVVIFNVAPDMVPTDLRERPLTEAARAIVRSGETRLIESIRKVSPKLFGDYAKTLPPPKDAPTLQTRRPPGQVVTSISPQLLRVNASVTDRHGRAIPNLKPSDFTIIENGQERRVTEVEPTSAPFNLVLLLDVSGSVEERIDFIRKAARNFLNTVSPQDRISIISFRDDIQVISDFTTDRRLLSRRLEDIDAGGATALYDALAYTLVEQLKKLRGERTAIVIMSDGDDNRSFVPFGAVLEATIESGALVYPLYIPSLLIPESSVPAPQTTLDPLRTRFLTLTTRATEEGRRLAQVSGGVYYPITRLEELQQAYDDVVAQLRMSYRITYASDANSAPERRRVSVRTKREGAAVRLSPPVSVEMP